MSDKSNRFTLRFSKIIQEQQKAYQIILGIPTGKRTDFICRAINQYALNQELDEVVFRAVKRAINDDPSIRREKQNNSEIREDIMDFLKGL